MKIVYCGFDFFFSCFEACTQGGHEVLALLTYECDGKYIHNSRVVARARELNIPIVMGKPDARVIGEYLRAGCELFVVAGYKYRLPVVDDPKFKGINVHPSLLPEGRGPWPLPHVILKDLPRTGVTIHKVSEQFDEGAILCQESFPVTSNDDLETLSCRSQIVARRLLDGVLANLEAVWVKGVPQGPGTYWPKLELQDRTIDWSKDVDDIQRVVRAFGKFDACARFGGRNWLVNDVSIWRETHSFRPGDVVHVSDREVVVAASDGCVCVRFYQEDME